MNYEETVKYLFSLLPMYQRVGKAAYKKDLTNTIELDKFFGHPHRYFNTVHVAGTNGKGSVSHFLASVLQEAGYKTGLYTSPHLKDYRERIKINGVEIEKEFVVDFVKLAKPAIERINPSFFELTVLMSFVYFKEKNVDLAVIETGMGGRLDSTNIITPLVSGITNISYDNSEFLGDTLAKIAAEKAGIIKKGVPVVIGEKKAETFGVFESAANEKGAGLAVAPDIYSIDYITETPEGLINVNVKDKSGKIVYGNLESSLTGQYQKYNIVTSLVALELLKNKVKIDDKHIYSGFRNVVPNTGIKGRWQVVSHNPEIIFDIAHNEDAVRNITASLMNIPYKHLRIVTGFVNDKNLEKIISLLPRDAFYYVTQASIPRAKDANELAKLFGAAGLKVVDINTNVKESLDKAISDSLPEDVVLVTGSAFVVAEVV